VKGLELAKETRPDLIILDLIMPDLDGFEVVQRLRTDEATRRIPILILTAKDLSVEERDRLRHRVQAIITKGGDSRLLVELHRLVARSPAAE
jgi:CheY-like chemotaxis protein